MVSYVKVAEDEWENPTELPVGEDGTISLSTLTSIFPGACGLKFKTESGMFRGVQFADAKFYTPENSWGDTVYYCVFPKENTRRSGNFSAVVVSGSTEVVEFGELDFTVLPMPTAKDLKVDNDLLRRKFYTGIANSEDMLQTFRLLKNQLNDFFKCHYLEVTENKLPAEDILKHLLNNTLVLKGTDDITTVSLHEVKLNDYPVSYPILVSETLLNKIDRTYCTSRVKEVGFCHLFVNNMRDSASSSYDSMIDDVESSAKKRKKTRKTCAIQKWVDCEGNLALHKDNITHIGNIVVVDILIFCMNTDVCVSLASHFGFIYLDDLVENSEEFKHTENIDERRAEISHRLSNKDAKLYREVQSLMNKKIILGSNTICFTSYIHLFQNAKASIKATIVEEDISDLNVISSRHSSVVIKVKDNCILQYIVAISEIIAHALNFNFNITAVYCKVKKVGDKVENFFYEVQFPLAGIIPLYILRFVAQLCKENPKNRIVYQNI